MSAPHPTIAAILHAFNQQVAQSAKPVHDIDRCALEPFPECGVCLSIVDPLAMRLMEATEQPDCARA